MLFNSIHFALFLPVVFVLYWFVAQRNLKIQNALLLVSSYFFYACWDWRFLFLLVFSTLLDYFTGIKIHEASSKSHRKAWLWISIGINLGFLGLFKYYNFFADSFVEGMAQLGLQANLGMIEVILPVGISFYTFHGLSYVIDIYKKRIAPERDAITYAVFVSFFPLLVAGPIERATHLLPQILKKRVFSYPKAVDGLRQILWGLFKKIVIADNCAEYANVIFNQSGDYSGTTLALGAILFALQIYGDFSGYSDIALGTARLFGIDLLRNFAFPYFSRDIAEFWRRWHISLSTWFRDYVYVPLGGSRGGLSMKIRNTFIIFLVSGFWHGANWTFIAWGALNALYFLPLLLTNKNRNNLEIVAQGKWLPSIKEVMQMSLTFGLTVLAWILFRATDITHAITYYQDMFVGLLDKAAYLQTLEFIRFKMGWLIPFLLFFFMGTEWIGREHPFAIARIGWKRHRLLRWSFYLLLLLGILYFGGNEQDFIYFQF